MERAFFRKEIIDQSKFKSNLKEQSQHDEG